MRKRPWFNRLLFTYLPVFYLAVIFLLFVFFMTVNGMMSRDMLRSSESYAKYIQQTIESSLQNIDRLIHGELQNNDDIYNFLYKRFDKTTGEGYLLEHRLSKKFKSIMVNETLIDSIYFYRAEDREVLSTSYVHSLESFGDRDFVESLEDGNVPHSWTGVRAYRPFHNHGQPSDVVSLVKRAPLLANTRGFLVINVSVHELGKLIDSMNTQNISATSIYDSEGRGISSGDEAGGGNAPISIVKSDYLGWEIHHSIQGNYNYRMMKDFSDGWMALGILGIVLATVVMIVIARRYTSPIDNAVRIIHTFSKSKSKDLSDRLNANPRFMDKAVDHLIELASQYSDIRQENSLHRRRQFFIELVGGERYAGFSEASMDNQLAAMLNEYDRLQIAIIEIDKFSRFSETYSSRDQYLIKYVISGAIKETAEEYAVQIWPEWLDQCRLTVLFQSGGLDNDANKVIFEICDKLRMWIEQHLDYSVSIGIGHAVTELREVAYSKGAAEKALAHKASVGSNSVIPYWELEPQLQRESLQHLQAIRKVAESFKQRNEAWERDFIQFIDALKDRLISRQDAVNLLGYMIFHISREMSELPSSYSNVWEREVADLHEALKSFDSLDELRQRFIDVMRPVVADMEKLRVCKSNQMLARQAKDYIEKNYYCPDLSLSLLGEQLGLNQSYLSRLFKDEFAENFVDYLARIRIMRAKELLQETDRAIQDIAGAVGYVHYYSFNRAFKRLAGVTPGEYRRHEHPANVVE